MNPVVLYFASGESLYSGALLLVLAIVVSPFLQQRRSLFFRNIVAWLGLAMIVMASSPFAWTTYAIFYLSFAFWYLACNWTTSSPLRVKTQLTSITILLLVVATLCGAEFPHRTIPVITNQRSDHLVVIGDSISSGIDPRVPAWPTILQRMTGMPVKNLARAGAATIEGSDMAREINSADLLVLIEIGGNDLLSGVPSKDFARALESLLSSIAAPGRTVVMFELPLLPHRIGYGQAQRRLAAKYGIQLIPKRCFVDVIRGADATSDGVHLSDAGAWRMAQLVAQTLSGLHKPEKVENSTRRLPN